MSLFLQIYPDCLAQAIYVTFREAFPESSQLFNEEFKEDLGNTVFLWLSGMNLYSLNTDSYFDF